MSGEKALLAVSVGARSAEALADLDRLECALASAFPGRIVRRAFLGAAFRDRAPGPAEAIATLRASGAEDILLQPLLLTAGREYERLLDQAAGLRTGKPLLADAGACRAAACAIVESLPSPDEVVHILVPHSGEISGDILTLDRALAALGRADVCVSGGARDLGVPASAVLHPLLLTCGTHARRDLDAVRGRLAAAGSAVTCCYRGLAALPGIPELFAALAREVDT